MHRTITALNDSNMRMIVGEGTSVTSATKRTYQFWNGMLQQPVR
ncbi:hypothetical protein [Prevotella corporis]|uniref:Uncharacterized protein n=1 Tax=Prevotella corporis TaxID=28128 RepID=A0A133PVJ2_9BACT|nr:hypothetical protein [Prevotella corporis]KXA33371.1 hypothetical protein HMPREF3226_02438 [Prevotella corporis]